MNKKAAVLFLLLHLIAAVPAAALDESPSEIKIILESGADDPGLKAWAESLPARRDDDSLKILAARITEGFRGRGYVLSSVDEITLRRDGSVRIKMRDPRIEQIKVAGTARAESAVLYLSAMKGRVFNSSAVERGLSDLNREFFFAGSSASVEQGTGGGVILNVAVEEKKFTVTWGSAVSIPAGQYPFIAAEYLTGGTVISAGGGMSFGGEDVRAAHAELGASSAHVPARWQPFAVARYDLRDDYYGRYSYRYSSEAYSFSAGYKRSLDSVKVSAGASLSMVDPDGYEFANKNFYVTKISAALSAGNAGRLLKKKEGYSAEISADAARESMNSSFFAAAEGSLRRGFYVSHDLRGLMLTPFAAFYISSAEERFFLPYACDTLLFASEGTFAAARAKTSAGAALDYALMDDLLFASFTTGWMIYIDEAGYLKQTTGTAAGASAEMENFIISCGWVWNPFKHISKGGIYLSISGRSRF